MSFDIERIHKSSRKVTKFLRKNSKRPSSDAIHNLRTCAKSLETTFTTLRLDSKRKIKRLLHELKQVRKCAGKVRDMDVLTANALSMKPNGELDCLVQLIEYLGAERNKSARKLRLLVEMAGPELRKHLKRNSKRLEKLLAGSENKPADSDAALMTTARALALAAELNSPARLTRNNLHAYRLKVKELQNVLRLSEEAGNPEFLGKLIEVKDAIGEWHDWEELIAIATRLLDHGPSCKLIRQLKALSDSRYERALSLANHLRNNYLRPGKPKRLSQQTKTATLSMPVWKAASAVAQY